jgi:hypothetical protein
METRCLAEYFSDRGRCFSAIVDTQMGCMHHQTGNPLRFGMKSAGPRFFMHFINIKINANHAQHRDCFA